MIKWRLYISLWSPGDRFVYLCHSWKRRLEKLRRGNENVKKLEKEIQESFIETQKKFKDESVVKSKLLVRPIGSLDRNNAASVIFFPSAKNILAARQSTNQHRSWFSRHICCRGFRSHFNSLVFFTRETTSEIQAMTSLLFISSNNSYRHRQTTNADNKLIIPNIYRNN